MAGEVRLGSAFVELESKLSSSFGDSLDAARQQIENLGSTAEKVGKKLAVASAAFVGPLTAAAKVFLTLSRESRNSPLFNQQSAQVARDLGAAWDRVAVAGKLVSVAIGSALSPVVAETANRVALLISDIAQWIERNPKLIAQAFELGKALGVVGAVMIGVSKTLGILAFLFSPAGVIGIAIAGVGAILEAFGVLNLGIADTANALIDAISEFRIGGMEIRTWFTVIANTVVGVWEQVKHKLASVWDSIYSTAKIWMTKLVDFIGTDTVAKIADLFFFLGDKILEALEPVLNSIQPQLASIQKQIVRTLYALGQISALEMKRRFAEIDEGQTGTDLREGLQRGREGVAEFFKNFDADAIVSGIEEGLARRQGERDKALEATSAALDASTKAAKDADERRRVKGPQSRTLQDLTDLARQIAMPEGGAGAGVVGSFANVGITGDTRGIALQERAFAEAQKQGDTLKKIERNTKDTRARFNP